MKAKPPVPSISVPDVSGASRGDGPSGFFVTTMSRRLLNFPTITSPRLTRLRGNWSKVPGLAESLQGVEGRHASDYHDAVVEFLGSTGWAVKREWVVTLDAGNVGLIDVVAFKDDIGLALELDNRSPRGKSIIKLETLKASWWLTAVLLRNPK